MDKDCRRTFQTNSDFFSEGRRGAALRRQATAQYARSLRRTSHVNS